MHDPLYLNMYVLLVAEPGIGKSVALGEIAKFWRATGNLHISSDKVTAPAILDEFSEAPSQIYISQTQPYQYSSVIVCASEFGIFLPAYELSAMSILNNLFDCPAEFEERIRSRKEKLKIKNAHLSILGATQPSYLASLLPDAAWTQGFPSRCLMVYAGTQPKVPLFSMQSRNKNLYNDLLADMKAMGSLYGGMQWTPEAAAALNDWYMADFPPKPSHVRLQHYAARRMINVVKLSAVFSMSESSSFIIEKHHYQKALSLLIETESHMPDIFKSMGSTDDARIMDNLIHFVGREEARTGKEVHATRIIHFLSSQLATHRIDKFLEIAVSSGRLKCNPITKTYKLSGDVH